MLTFPNILSFFRFPLAILFFYENSAIRAVAIALAGVTDFLDGYLARRYSQTSRVGTILDPIADKAFVITAMSFFFLEGKISAFEASAMLCRDFSVILFGCFLLLSGKFQKYQFRSIWAGKLTTTAQLAVLGALTLGIALPSAFYGLFILFGGLALIELYTSL